MLYRSFVAVVAVARCRHKAGTSRKAQMPRSPTVPLLPSFPAIPIVPSAALLSMGAGLAVMLGWFLDLPLLRSIVPGAVEMKFNTALALVLAGGALFVYSRLAQRQFQRLAQGASALVAALGWSTLGEYAFGWQLGIDELLMRDNGNAFNAIPGRMSPYSALSFGALGIALFLLPGRQLQALVGLLAALVALVGGVSLLGYAWNASELVTDNMLPPVALHTAACLVLLGLGTLGTVQRLRRQVPHDRATPTPGRSRASIEIKAAAGFVGVFALLIVAGGVSYRTNDDFAQSALRITQSQEARAALRLLYESVSEAEKAARTYTLSSEPRDKGGYLNYADEVRRRSHELENLLGSNLEHQALLAHLNELWRQRLRLSEQSMVASDSKGRWGATVASLEEGTRLMAALREVTYQMDNAEASLLVQREAHARNERQKALLFLVLTLTSAAAIFAFLLHSIRHEMLARSEADARLRQLNAELEQRVEERTAELQSNQRRLIDLFEFAPDALVMADRLGHIVQVNRQAETLFGWNRDELVGQPVEVLMPASAQANHIALRERFLQSALPRPMGAGRPNLRASRKDGTEFSVDISLSPLESGGDFVVVAAVRDTTEREHMNGALRASAALYRDTLDNMLEGCQIIGPDWRYRYINAAAAKHNRRPAEDLVGQTLMASFPGIEKTEIFVKMATCMTQRTRQYSEVEFDFPDGSRGWFQVSVVPAPEGISVFSVDVSDRRQAEAELLSANADLERRVAERTAELVQAREAAETANLAKSAFLATMSHEIRTPMNGVVGMVEVLSHSQMPPQQADAVRTIRASAFSLLNILDDILDFSKIEAGRLELERAPVALPDLIESVCDTLLPVAVSKNVELNLFIAPDVPAQVWSDATRLRQVLFNLAGNAIKFGAGEPQRPGWVSIRVTIEGGAERQLVLRVTDNGIGMAPESIDHLFSSFTQAEVSTTRRFGGTGLGLAICKRLVMLMNGDIHVRSALNEGATFTVTLPLDVLQDGGAGQGMRHTNISDLDCILVGTDAHADDIRVYLEHAGARVRMVPDLAVAAARALHLERPVVIQNTPREPLSLAPLHETFAAVPDARHLLIVRGWGQRPRMTASDVVVLDGNCLRRSSLLRAVAVAAGLASPEVLRERLELDLSLAPAGPINHAQARAQGRLVLIAEDDAVNQTVILRQIELLGFAAEIADNGGEALRLWRAGHYALLLTDLHMPDMDGYTLAENIRREEARKGTAPGKRLPILALTANALRGEAMRAQAVGMDEYLTKPLQLHLLKAALEKWMPPPADDAQAATGREAQAVSAPGLEPQPAPVVDVGVLKDLVGDDPQTVRKILTEYLAQASRLSAELRSTRDHRQVSAIAHKLKSASRSVGALALGDLCAELENASLTGMRDGLDRGIAQFEVAMHEADAQISDYLGLT
jgi:PAS domain S-box-containing protein